AGPTRSSRMSAAGTLPPASYQVPSVNAARTMVSTSLDPTRYIYQGKALSASFLAHASLARVDDPFQGRARSARAASTAATVADQPLSSLESGRPARSSAWSTVSTVS